MDSSTLTLWTSPFPNEEMSGKILLLPYYIEIPVFNANGEDPDQMPHSVASDLVYTVCQCPFYGTLGTNGLRSLYALVMSKTCKIRVNSLHVA